MDLPLRRNVCLIILNNENLIFLGERKGASGIWQFPQGGVNSGSTLEENALREAQEELGVELNQLRIIRKLKATHEYEFDIVPRYAEGRFRGQSQTFWLLRFTGADSDIKLDRYEAELSSFCWCTLEEIESLAEPKRLPGYSPALREVRDFLAE